MSEGKVYNIPATRFQWFKERMDTLSKKALKITGKRSFFTAVGFHPEEDKNSRWFGQKIMEVFVAVPEPKYDGWTFAARIDHANEAGNIIRSTGLMDIPEHYREADPVCDHCGHKRRRRDTFLVHHEEKGFQQVGSSCLADFLGHKDVASIAKLAELMSSVHYFVRSSFEGDLADLRNISVERYLEYVAQTIFENGWTSKSVAFRNNQISTADLAYSNYRGINDIRISDLAADLARQAHEWALALDESDEPLNDYQYNCWVVANSPGLEPRSLGIAASIVGVFFEKTYKLERPAHLDEFVGNVGDKLTVSVLPSYVRDNGNYVIHKAQDEEGHEFVWFANKPMFSIGKHNTFIKLRATVKAHSEYNNKKSTMINYVKVVD